MEHLPPVEVVIVATVVHVAVARLVMRLRRLSVYGLSWYPFLGFLGAAGFTAAWLGIHRGAATGHIMWLIFGVVLAAGWVLSIVSPEGVLSPDEARQRLDLLAAALGSEDAGRLERAVNADGHQAVAAWLWPSVRHVRQNAPQRDDRSLTWASKRLRSRPAAVSC